MVKICPSQAPCSPLRYTNVCYKSFELSHSKTSCSNPPGESASNEACARVDRSWNVAADHVGGRTRSGDEEFRPAKINPTRVSQSFNAQPSISITYYGSRLSRSHLRGDIWQNVIKRKMLIGGLRAPTTLLRSRTHHQLGKR